LIAVIVILGIILAIAIPTITGMIRSSSKSSFESNAKLLLKAVDYKKLEIDSFDPTTVNKNTINSLLGLSNENYENLTITLEDNIPVISIIGKNKWEGFIVCGT
jgi:type II secretory pathway pseudopilin PulG